ncbi:MAG: hypothetical protein MZW92_25180 [Comamonadaceae bacterium]|nr:hypothetical protein [Comamonadaceae bacterium]
MSTAAAVDALTRGSRASAPVPLPVGAGAAVLRAALPRGHGQAQRQRRRDPEALRRHSAAWTTIVARSGSRPSAATDLRGDVVAFLGASHMRNSAGSEWRSGKPRWPAAVAAGGAHLPVPAALRVLLQPGGLRALRPAN